MLSVHYSEYIVLFIQDWFEHFKEQILDAEQTLLTALDFELTVEHPYKLLMTVFNKIGLLHSALSQMTLKLVNDG